MKKDEIPADKFIERELYIMFDINDTKHTGESHLYVMENGEPKESWTPQQLISTARMLRNYADQMYDRVMAEIMNVDEFKKIDWNIILNDAQ